MEVVNARESRSQSMASHNFPISPKKYSETSIEMRDYESGGGGVSRRDYGSRGDIQRNSVISTRAPYIVGRASLRATDSPIQMKNSSEVLDTINLN